MRQQLMDRDLGCDVLVRIVSQIFSHRVFHVQLACLCQLQYRNRGEHLVHRSDAEASLQRIGRLVFPVGQTVGLGENRLAVFCDQHSSRKTVCRDFRFNGFSRSGDEPALREVRQRKFGRARDGPQFDTVDLVRFVGLHFHRELRELIR